MRAVLYAVLFAFLSVLIVAACGGDGGTVTPLSDAGQSETSAATEATVGGSVTGLVGSGLLLKNGSENLAINGNGPFTFKTAVKVGAPYGVTIAQQPAAPTQVCSVGSGAGTMSPTGVTNVAITCAAATYTIGGTLTGLLGAGLTLKNNGGDDLPVSVNGEFTFKTPIASGSPFAVTVATQPSGPIQTCSVTGGTGTVGTGNVTSIAVTCSPAKFPIGGTVSGLKGTLVLKNNGGDDLSLNADGTFAFATPLETDQDYAVSIFKQPTSPSQTCSIVNEAGKVGGAAVTTIAVTCVTDKFYVRGNLSGLAAAESVTLRVNGTNDLNIVTDGNFLFATPLDSGTTYTVSVFANPTSPIAQTCTVSNGTGAIGAGDVTNVTVSCTANKYSVLVKVTGLKGSGLVLQNNGGNDLAVPNDNTYTFSTQVQSGMPYNVTVFKNPTGPTQSCFVAAGSGTITNDKVNVNVTCTDGIVCANIVTTANVWGNAAKGIDLRPFTSGTLDWIGCPGDGCIPSAFFCTDEANGIFFGSTANELRALVDPGNTSNDYPTSYSGCCSAASPRSICNAPMAANNGVGGINSADALCKAMGFSSGVVVVEVNSNSCPKPHSTTANGSNWTSNWAGTAGYGQQYRCTR